MAAEVLMSYVTCPDAQTAEEIASSLVERRLAACVNIVPGLRSVYRWQGKVEINAELLLLIKTTQHRFEAVRETVLERHPDELPEIVAVPIAHGLPGYLDWVRTETAPE